MRIPIGDSTLGYISTYTDIYQLKHEFIKAHSECNRELISFGEFKAKYNTKTRFAYEKKEYDFSSIIKKFKNKYI